MEIILNEETGIREMFINGTLKSVSPEVRTLDNEKKTPFRWTKVDIVYPNGKTATVDSMLWEASLEKLPDAFAVGNTVALATQLEGDYAGMSKVGLPTIQRVDITQFDLSSIEVEKEVTTTV